METIHKHTHTHTEIKQYAPDSGSMRKLRRKFKKCIETNDNGNTTYQHLWDTVQAVLKEKFIAISAYIKKKEKKEKKNFFK